MPRATSPTWPRPRAATEEPVDPETWQISRAAVSPRGRPDVSERSSDYNSSSSDMSGNFGRLRRRRIKTRPRTTAANTTPTIRAHTSGPKPSTPWVTATSWIEGVTVCAATTVAAWDFVSNPAASTWIVYEPWGTFMNVNWPVAFVVVTAVSVVPLRSRTLAPAIG